MSDFVIVVYLFYYRLQDFRLDVHYLVTRHLWLEHLLWLDVIKLHEKPS